VGRYTMAASPEPFCASNLQVLGGWLVVCVVKILVVQSRGRGIFEDF